MSTNTNETNPHFEKQDSSSTEEDLDAASDGVPSLYQKKTLKKISEETHTIKAKRKYNPLDEKYRGFDSTQETMVAEIEYMDTLNSEQSKLFAKNKLIFDVAKLDALWNEIKVQDILGYKGSMYLVEGKTKSNLSLNKLKPKRYLSDPNETTFDNTFQDNNLKVSRYDLDYALNIKFTDILYRDGKPYGLPEEFEYKTKVVLYEDDDGKVYTKERGYEVKPGEETPAIPSEVP
jgi:hypothetical protein